MSTQLSFGRDINGLNAFAPAFAQDKYAVTLSSGVAQSLTIPSNYTNWIVSFSFQPGTNVWVALNTTAALPTGSIAATSSEQNPGQRIAQAGNTISFITNNSNADVGIVLYAIN